MTSGQYFDQAQRTQKNHISEVMQAREKGSKKYERVFHMKRGGGGEGGVCSVMQVSGGRAPSQSPANT